MQNESITGVFDKVLWYSKEPGDTYCLCSLRDGTKVAGKFRPNDPPVKGIEYEWHGRWKQRDDGTKEFRFKEGQYVAKKLHSREAVIEYLKRFGGVGPASAAKLWDAFKQDAVSVVRDSPQSAKDIVKSWMPLERLEECSQQLKSVQAMEGVRIELTELFHGLHFPASVIEECIAKWYLLAPQRIRKNPFCLLEAGIKGCGFDRVDSLYLSLGLPPGRLRRQTFAVWNYLKKDTSGNTWIFVGHVVDELQAKISGAKVKARAAIRFGLKIGLFAKHRDEDGVLYLAESGKARDEDKLAAKILELVS